MSTIIHGDQQWMNEWWFITRHYQLDSFVSSSSSSSSCCCSSLGNGTESESQSTVAFWRCPIVVSVEAKTTTTNADGLWQLAADGTPCSPMSCCCCCCYCWLVGWLTGNCQSIIVAVIIMIIRLYNRAIIHYSTHLRITQLPKLVVFSFSLSLSMHLTIHARTILGYRRNIRIDRFFQSWSTLYALWNHCTGSQVISWL